jgi:uncharacterized cupin superfamily protein
VIPVAAALAASLEFERVPAEQVVAGAPETGAATLGHFHGQEFGVWEMTAGAMTDTETDELFVVVAGEASVLLVDSGETLSLEPGSVVELTEGLRTVWTVPSRIRKVYLSHE